MRTLVAQAAKPTIARATPALTRCFESTAMVHLYLRDLIFEHVGNGFKRLTHKHFTLRLEDTPDTETHRAAVLKRR
jgi:hypothetical protein